MINLLQTVIPGKNNHTEYAGYNYTSLCVTVS